MRTKILIAAFVASLLIQSSVFGQGALTPPGAPAPTMKTLSQVEPRTPVSSAPFVITTSGSYYLTTNLVVSSNNAIDINATGVTLDLNGFTISSSSPVNSGIAISLDYANDVTIFNGHIVGGVTNKGNGVYSGPGFNHGISWVGWAPQNVRISGVSVSGVLSYGINVLGGTTTTLVEGCTVHTLGNNGISAYIVKSCSAMDCGSYGIFGGEISDCTGQATASGGTGIFANFSVQNSYGYATNGNNCSGIYCDGTALNCYGYSGGSGEGIFTETAANCYGFNVNGAGFGLDASIAENSYGNSTSGTALSAELAQNSQGVTTSGTGVAANIAISCYGYVSTGISGSYGIYSSTAENCYALNYGAGIGTYALVALNCYSYCASGTAMNAFTANSCHAVTTSGITYSVTHNVNSY